MTNPARLDKIRSGVLDRMQRAERTRRYAILAAGVAEMLMFVGAFALVDFSNHLEKLIFILFILFYATIALGLVALGAHVTRSMMRVIGAIESAESSG